MPAADVALRPFTDADFVPLVEWLADPLVQRWWGTPLDPAGARAAYGADLEEKPLSRLFVIEVHGVPSGIAQSYRNADHPGWLQTIVGAVPALAGHRSAGIDYLLGRADARGRGAGTAAIGALTELVLADLPDVEVVVAAVQQENRPSWRALERAGYERVWAGRLVSDDPTDAGPAYVLTRWRD